MPLFDEDEEAGLEDELQDETVDETADEEVPYGPLDSLASIAELRKQLSSASSEAEKNRKVLEQIQAARLKLLEAPSRKEALMGLAQKLAAPRTQNDPRFYERQNLYTFLRDVGEYGQERKQAEKERQVKIAAIEEMGAKYGLTEAQKTQEAAMRGLTSLAQRQMMIEAQKGRPKSLQADAQKIIDLQSIINDPKRSTEEKRAAQREFNSIGAVDSSGLSPADVRSIRLEVASTLSGPKDRLTTINEGLSNLGLAIKGNPQAEAQLNRSLATISGDKQLSMAEVESVVGAGSFAQRVTNAISKFFTGGAGDLTNEQKKELLETYEAYYANQYNNSRKRLKNIYSGAGLTNLPEDIFDSPYISVTERRNRRRSEGPPAGSEVKTPAQLAADELLRREQAKKK
jgi:hypothetical protein